MKVAGNGQARLLSSEELKLLFSEGFKCQRDKALFGICLHTGCRISEALKLRVVDVTFTHILFRKANTKGQLDSREVRVTPSLLITLGDYNPTGEWFFPGRSYLGSPLNRNTADRILNGACNRVGFSGVSTHSFRRTALTQMHNAGIPLRIIQKISGHRDLAQLTTYLAFTEDQLYAAALAVRY
jgi:integrase/recombinase XerD